MKTDNQKVYIRIKNKGEVDLGAFHLMGVSSKRDEEGKIGFFGSGNKYALAVLLRNNIDFKIFSGARQMEISVKPVMFRNKMYEQIIVDGVETSLTTSMGVDWESWYSIREMYCNAVDEGAEPLSITKDVVGIEGSTSIYIELTEELGRFFKNIDRYIIMTDEPIEVTYTEYGKISIYENSEREYVCYRRGIRITPENERPALFRYDFESIEINESRTFKYEHEVYERIAAAIGAAKNQNIIKKYLASWNGKETTYWQYVDSPLSESWREVLSGKRIYPMGVAMHSGDFEGKANSIIVQDELAAKIAKDFPEMEVVGYQNGKNYLLLEATRKETDLIAQAISDLSRIGYEIKQEIVLVKSSLSDVIGWYDRDQDKIFLTREHLGTLSHLKNTLMEEHFHSIGFNDGQRALVTALIDEIIKTKESNL